MLDGDSRRWVAEFRRLDDRFLHCVMGMWWKVVVRLGSNPDEDEITNTLVTELACDRDARHLFNCHCPFRTIEWGPDGVMEESRYIDMALVFDHDRRVYLAYECKKLNVAHKDGRRRSQSERYVGREGMMRFVTGKYARGMPVACMMGYVMDGDLSFACAHVKATIGRNRSRLRLQYGPTDEPSLDAMSRFVTTHQRNGDGIELRHALLPFVQAGS